MKSGACLMSATTTSPQAGRPWQGRWWLLAAVAAPPAAAAVLMPFRSAFANTDLALIMVLVTVGVAAVGNRVAGILAAISTAVWFDFFFTQPYQRLSIDRRVDMETTVLLLLVGVAVSELAVWGRRQHEQVARQAGYDAGIRDAAASVAGPASASGRIEQVRHQLTALLGLDSCTFDFGAAVLGGRRYRLRSDGQVVVAGTVLDVDRDGLPTNADIELPVTSGTGYHGRFVLRAHAGARPTAAQRVVAVALANQVGNELAGSTHLTSS